MENVISLAEGYEDFWKSEYESRLRTDRKDELIEFPESVDRRKLPRLVLEPGKNVWLIADTFPISVLNISAGGIAFFSERNYHPGDTVNLSVARTLAIEAVVLSCEMVRTDSVFMEYRYRVRAKYAPGVSGFKMFVLARDIYVHNLEKPAPEAQPE